MLFVVLLLIYQCNTCRGGYRSRRKNRSGVGDGTRV